MHSGLIAQNEGDPAPDFTVNLQNGETFTMSDHEGSVVFMFFFGNSCSSCLSVGSSIESEIFQEFASDGNFRAIGLDTWDSSSGESSVGNFRTQTGITFPLAIKAGSVAKDYSTTYDRLLVVDAEGIIRHKGTAAASNDIDNAIAAIENHLMTTSVETGKAQETLTVFPNPAGRELHLRYPAGVPGTNRIEVTDLSGRIVLHHSWSGQGSDGTLTLPVEKLPGGLYVVHYQNGGNTLSKRLVIRRSPE